jgi:hypothetical protein
MALMAKLLGLKMDGKDAADFCSDRELCSYRVFAASAAQSRRRGYNKRRAEMRLSPGRARANRAAA